MVCALHCLILRSVSLALQKEQQEQAVEHELAYQLWVLRARCDVLEAGRIRNPD